MKDSVAIYRLNDDMSTTVLAIQAHHGKASSILLYELWNICLHWLKCMKHNHQCTLY